MATATALLADLADVGRDPAGGYTRLAWTRPTGELREWFGQEAARRGLRVHTDGNGNQIARWGEGGDALLLGSHLDSVPGGGAFDGPLGIASSFAALDLLRAEGFVPRRPILIADFTDEEGGRFGLACVGSRLAAGVLRPERALALTDGDGVTLADALRQAGLAPEAAGPSAWLDDVSTFVELHVEQGRGLVDAGTAVGVASAIWPHGRYRLDVHGCGNHAGTTAMTDRRDPMLTYAATVLAAARAASEPGLRATFGRVEVSPGSTNSIPSRVTAWLDARADAPERLEALVDRILAGARSAAEDDGTEVRLRAESRSDAVTFDPGLRHRLAAVLDAPVLATGAGHDAGILAARVPTAMLFVRNPSGVSHAPEEYAEPADCEAGVAALAAVIRELA